jgi:hypothetical protein
VTPEQQVDAVRAALAEAGYPNVHVWLATTPITGVARPHADAWAVSGETYWRAMAVVGLVTTCWPCWSSWSAAGRPKHENNPCTHDYRTEPWPPVVVPHA